MNLCYIHNVLWQRFRDDIATIYGDIVTMLDIQNILSILFANYSIHDMNKSNDLRHTITINDITFKKLRREGFFGESYSDLISRLLYQTENILNEEEK